MRILTLTNLYPNPYQPHRAAFNRNQLRLLGERHPIRIIAPIAWTDELASRWRGGAPLPAGRRARLDGLDIEHPRYLFTPKVLRRTYGRSYRASVLPAFSRALDEFRPEIIFAPWAYPDGWAAVELGHRVRLPVVVKVHGSDILLLGRHPSRAGPTADALRRADAVIAVSADLSGRIIGLGADPARVRIIYDGVDRGRFSPGSKRDARARLGLDADTPIVLSVGNLVTVKGQDVLIDACARLAREGVRFDCCLIGRGPLRPALERQAARLGLGDRFRMLGALPQDDLPDWYRAADVFALPSHSEGVPNVLLEASACGTPFVASRVGGIPEIDRVGSCHLVPPGDASTLADALARFLDDRISTARVPEAVRDVSETVEEMEQLFEEVLEARGRPAPGPSSQARRPSPSMKDYS